MPLPPEEPDLDACCGSGCNPCIFDLHDMAMERYREALRAWRKRQSGHEHGVDRKGGGTERA
ncbi:MAG TPA: oxidoreductase-like domain-containing protein [Burkholderiaceae bacterium]|nr:oxidoreductase-like domain-containing protein [Burkholderiaceae bacterium]